MAGFFRTTEAAAAAAESCEGTAANIIQQTIAPPGQLPASFLSSSVPVGPVPATNGPTLQSEITGATLPVPPAVSAGLPSENSTDAAATSPNLTLSINGFTVNGDIDRLYIHNKPGMDPTKEGGQGNPLPDYLRRLKHRNRHKQYGHFCLWMYLLLNWLLQEDLGGVMSRVHSVKSLSFAVVTSLLITVIHPLAGICQTGSSPVTVGYKSGHVNEVRFTSIEIDERSYELKSDVVILDHKGNPRRSIELFRPPLLSFISRKVMSIKWW